MEELPLIIFATRPLLSLTRLHACKVRLVPPTKNSPEVWMAYSYVYTDVVALWGASMGAPSICRPSSWTHLIYRRAVFHLHLKQDNTDHLNQSFGCTAVTCLYDVYLHISTQLFPSCSHTCFPAALRICSFVNKTPSAQSTTHPQSLTRHDERSLRTFLLQRHATSLLTTMP
jgi:hypothetical protein